MMKEDSEFNGKNMGFYMGQFVHNDICKECAQRALGRPNAGPKQAQKAGLKASQELIIECILFFQIMQLNNWAAYPRE